MSNLQLDGFSEKESKEWVGGIANTLLERFSKQLASGEITFPEAVEKAVKKYAEIQNNISMQLLTGHTNRKEDKINAFTDAILDDVYNSLNN